MIEISGISVFMAFLAGVVSFLSPCVLPLVPGYVAYVSGHSLEDLGAANSYRARASAVMLSLFFVLGFSVVFISFGASASAIGQLLFSYRYEMNYVAGAVVIAFGLFTMGLFQPRWMQREMRFAGRIPGGRPTGAFVLGSAFAFGWTPCIGPILGAILAISATSVSVASGSALLAIYAAGLAVPFLLVAALTGTFVGRLGAMKRAGRVLRPVAGGVMVLMGVAILTDTLTAFGFWMLRTFPILQQVLL
jgi:cytochrome c-type biogenesis protein